MAVNLNIGVRIKLQRRLKEFVLTIETDTFAAIIDSYPTQVRALQAFEHMTDRIEAKRPMCDAAEL